MGIQQNEEVDRLAKEEASSETTTCHTLHHISISQPKVKIPTNCVGSRTNKDKIKDPPKLITQALDQLEKGLASTIHQLCTNHSPLYMYLHQIKQM
ncbi:hypothetical protein O181_088877 [Austropuccinia psidii MF-1]|uniref:Uncharacterized protein n=1 Tax=Austropuccinia psidii MF-1 TaxID=1389203 RepID=A0A9Q3ISD1_9BASI|nr:hypothetical protein [Austropuccinia psidii MF-1]